MSIASLATIKTIPVVTDVRWNQNSFDAAGATAKEWNQRQQELKQQDNKLLVEGVVDSYSSMKVEEYVSFSKTFTPFVKFESHVVDAVSPANQKVCEQPKNQAAATECLNTWMLAGMKQSQKKSLEECFRKAGCASNWMNASPAERQGLKNEFHKSVDTIATQYKGQNDQFVSGVKVAWGKHEERVAHMHLVFREYLVKSATQLGCDRTCVIKATANKYQNFGETMPKCGCGTDAWKITQTDVNVMAATENVYGDLEALNEVDVSDIQSAIIRMDM